MYINIYVYVCVWAHIKTIYGKIFHEFEKSKEGYMRSTEGRKEKEQIM